MDHFPLIEGGDSNHSLLVQSIWAGQHDIDIDKRTTGWHKTSTGLIQVPGHTMVAHWHESSARSANGP